MLSVLCFCFVLFCFTISSFLGSVGPAAERREWRGPHVEMTTMEGASGSSFGIDTILSSASSGSPGMMNGDFRPLGEPRTADFRSQATPSPCSEIDTVGTAPSSPISVTMEPPEPPLVADGPQQHLHHHLHHGPQPPPCAGAPTQSLQPSPPPPAPQPPPPPPPPAQQLGSAASAPRTSTSSFLIKDILGDCKPLAACAPYSTSVSSPHPTPKPESNAPHESFRPKLEQDEGKTKLDKREDAQGDIKCHGESRRLGWLPGLAAIPPPVSRLPPLPQALEHLRWGVDAPASQGGTVPPSKPTVWREARACDMEIHPKCFLKKLSLFYSLFLSLHPYRH